MVNFMLLFDLPENPSILFHMDWLERSSGPGGGGEAVHEYHFIERKQG